MKRNNKGISIVEAAIVLGLVSVVAIGVLSLLGGEVNTMFNKSKTEFEGYKPFGNTSTSTTTSTGAEMTGISTKTVEGGTGEIDPASTPAEI